MHSAAASLLSSSSRRSGMSGMKRRSMAVLGACLLLCPGPAAGLAHAAEAAEVGAPLAGSFLGALFFGYPFESVGTPDILLLLIIGLVLMRVAAGKNRNNGQSGTRQNDRQDRESFRDQFLKASRDEEKRGNEERDSNEEGGWNAWRRDRKSPPRQENKPDAPPQNTMHRQARATWDALRSRQPENDRERTGAEQTAAASGLAGAMQVAAGVSVPRGFDVEDFLGGAKALYSRLQHSWAARDVDDLEPFVSESMLSILREQSALDPQPGEVQILLVTAVLSGFHSEGGSEDVSVTFDAVIHDGPESGKTEPVSVRELWHFVRGPGTGGTWRLDGIEQV